MTVPFFSKTSAVHVVRGLLRDREAPLSAMIEIADRCNHTCVHCYQVQGQKGEMSTDEIRRVLDELADLGVLFLTLSGGESTLREDFLEIVAHARRRRFAVKVFTNGFTMSRELARSLAELAVHEVQISLYSHRADVHDWVTRVPGSWERTTRGARLLIDEGVRVVLKTPLMSVNVEQRAEYVEFVTSLGADYLFDVEGLNPREDGDRSPEALSPTHRQIGEVMRDPALSGPAPESSPPPVAASRDASVCGACSGNVHIEANGELRPCTQLTVACGNVRGGGVVDAWRSSTSASIRALTWRDLHGCRDCDLQPFCGHCYADASVMRGDALGPYEHGCSMARLRFEATTKRAFVLANDASDVERDPSLGPYRERPDGRFEMSPDVVEPRDLELAASLGWTRSTPRDAPAPAAIPGGLVQIRRLRRDAPATEPIDEPHARSAQASR